MTGVVYELIIIGGGPAAIAAGIYTARKKLKTLLIAKDWGGQIMGTNLIENYPGFETITGPDLINKFVGHLKKNQLEIKEGSQVKEVALAKEGIKVKTEDNLYQGKALIVASGRYPKKLGLSNEEKFIGKGISYCTTCDGPLFKDKEVAVIGGGNAGMEAALDLTNYASKIYILEFLPQLTGDELFQERVAKNPKITILTNVEVKKIKGEQFVKGLVYQDRSSKKTKEIAMEGIFVEIGSMANSSFIKNVVKLNEEGEIKVDSKNKTSQPNIFAAGDVTDVSHKQVIIAAGQGAKAALNAYEYLQSHSEP